MHIKTQLLLPFGLILWRFLKNDLKFHSPFRKPLSKTSVPRLQRCSHKTCLPLCSLRSHYFSLFLFISDSSSQPFSSFYFLQHRFLVLFSAFFTILSSLSPSLSQQSKFPFYLSSQPSIWALKAKEVNNPAITTATGTVAHSQPLLAAGSIGSLKFFLLLKVIFCDLSGICVHETYIQGCGART